MIAEAARGRGRAPASRSPCSGRARARSTSGTGTGWPPRSSSLEGRQSRRRLAAPARHRLRAGFAAHRPPRRSVPGRLRVGLVHPSRLVEPRRRLVAVPARPTVPAGGTARPDCGPSCTRTPPVRRTVTCSGGSNPTGTVPGPTVRSGSKSWSPRHPRRTGRSGSSRCRSISPAGSSCFISAPDEPLRFLVTEPRAIAVEAQRRSLATYPRLPAALAARRYAAAVDVVIEVTDDRFPANHGRWHLVGSPDHAVCTPTDAPADLALDVHALGAAYLGGTSLATLAAGGRGARSPRRARRERVDRVRLAPAAVGDRDLLSH